MRVRKISNKLFFIKATNASFMYNRIEIVEVLYIAWSALQHMAKPLNVRFLFQESRLGAWLGAQLYAEVVQ